MLPEQDVTGPGERPGGERLDLAPFVSAVARLQEGLERHRREPGDEQLRDGLIQRFEFTYEPAHRMLRRYLRQVSPSPALVDQMSFAELIRMAADQGLVSSDWPAWRRYREMRARTGHTDAAAVAVAVVAGIPDFLADAIDLRDRLQGRLG